MASATRLTRPSMPRLLSGAVLTVAAALAAGCSAAPAPAAGAGGQAGAGRLSAGPPAITAARARQVFDRYVATMTRASRAGDAALALSVVTGVQQAAVDAAARAARFSGGKPSLGRYGYGEPTFYLPAPAGYPRFFVASAARRYLGGQRAPAAAELIGGPAVPRDGTALLVFEQESAGAPWRLGSVSMLPAGVAMPRLATGPRGAVARLPLSAAGLLARPDVAGPLQAAVVDDGPAAAAARAVAAGPLTTGMYRAARGHALGLRPPAGDVYQWELEGSSLPKFALRTVGGGALVFYAMYLNTTVAVPGYISGANPIEPGPPIRYPGELGPWLSPARPAPRVSVEEQLLLSFAAVDPPPGGAKISVIAIGGTLNYAAAS